MWAEIDAAAGALMLFSKKGGDELQCVDLSDCEAATAKDDDVEITRQSDAPVGFWAQDRREGACLAPCAQHCSAVQTRGNCAHPSSSQAFIDRSLDAAVSPGGAPLRGRRSGVVRGDQRRRAGCRYDAGAGPLGLAAGLGKMRACVFGGGLGCTNLGCRLHPHRAPTMGLAAGKPCGRSRA